MAVTISADGLSIVHKGSALLNLAIDCKLRSCDLLRMKVGDVYSQGIVHPRVQLNQSKTGNDVQFEITPRSQQSISRWIYS